MKLSWNVVPATLWTNIFGKERTSVNFISERKCCDALDQIFLKDLTNVPTRSQSILSKLGKINQELSVENVHVVNHGVGDACLIEWDRINVNVRHSEARGSGVMLPLERLKFGPLEWLKMH